MMCSAVSKCRGNCHVETELWTVRRCDVTQMHCLAAWSLIEREEGHTDNCYDTLSGHHHTGDRAASEGRIDVDKWSRSKNQGLKDMDEHYASL